MSESARIFSPTLIPSNGLMGSVSIRGTPSSCAAFNKRLKTVPIGWRIAVVVAAVPFAAYPALMGIAWLAVEPLIFRNGSEYKVQAEEVMLGTIVKIEAYRHSASGRFAPRCQISSQLV